MKPLLSQAIQLTLKPSLLLLGLLVVVSIVCCFILAQLAVPLSIKLGLIVLVILSSTYFMLRDALLSLPSSWQILEVNSKGELKMTNQQGIVFAPTLAKHTVVFAWMTILNFRRVSWLRGLPPVILFGQGDTHRRLRVWLQWWQHHDGLAVPDEIVL